MGMTRNCKRETNTDKGYFSRFVQIHFSVDSHSLVIRMFSF